jgi:hypothetical protein
VEKVCLPRSDCDRRLRRTNHPRKSRGSGDFGGQHEQEFRLRHIGEDRIWEEDAFRGQAITDLLEDTTHCYIHYAGLYHMRSRT